MIDYLNCNFSPSFIYKNEQIRSPCFPNPSSVPFPTLHDKKLTCIRAFKDSIINSKYSLLYTPPL